MAGDMDIHAISIEVTEKGYPVQEKVPSQTIVVCSYWLWLL